MHLNVHILASTSAPFRTTTVQMPNLALIETKRITVAKLYWRKKGLAVYLHNRAKKKSKNKEREGVEPPPV
jgi:hypothetical protein